MTNSRLIPALILAIAAALPAAAAPGRNAVTPEQIAAAMANAGMQVSPKQVELLTDVMATIPAPALKIRSMEPWGDHRMMVRLDCAQPEQCLPFFVAVRFSQGSELRPVAASSDDSSPAISRAKPASSVPTIRSGASATLLIDGDHIHIKLSVVTLENGSTGQVIRVSSKDHKQVYMAEVVDGSSLRGAL